MRMTRKIIEDAITYIPVVSNVLFTTKYRIFDGKTLISLFDLDVLKPWKLQNRIDCAKSGVLKLSGLSPHAQLTVFRLLRDVGAYNESTVYKLMSRWLKCLSGQKRILRTK
jgi:hypothetical protein